METGHRRCKGLFKIKAFLSRDLLKSIAKGQICLEIVYLFSCSIHSTSLSTHHLISVTK